MGLFIYRKVKRELDHFHVGSLAHGTYIEDGILTKTSLIAKRILKAP